MVHKHHSASIELFKKISSRVSKTQFKCEILFKISQVYAPTIDHTDDEVDLFYEDVSGVTGIVFTLLCGYFNAQIGLKTDE